MNLQQKNIVLILGFIALLMVAYQLSFSKTFELNEQYNSLKNERVLFDNISEKFMNLKKQNIYYDSILKSKKIFFNTSFQNNLLSTINSFADTTNITIISFQNPHIFKTSDVETHTYVFTVKGNFNTITQLLFKLEQEYKLGKIISVDYKKKKNYKRNSEYLECVILLQQIK